MVKNLKFGFLLLSMAMSLFACKEDESDKADAYFKKGDYKKAVSLYDEYLAMYPRHVKSLYNRGRSYEELNQYDKAMQDYKKVLEIDPKNTQALQSVGLDYYRRKDYEQAAYYFDQSLQIQDKDYYAHYLKGRAEHLLGNTEEAMNEYEKAINLKNDFGEVYLYRGALYLHMKKKNAACKDFKMAENLGVDEATKAIEQNCK